MPMPFGSTEKKTAFRTQGRSLLLARSSKENLSLFVLLAGDEFLMEDTQKQRLNGFTISVYHNLANFGCFASFFS